MISFQKFSFRYEESQDFTLCGIDMTVQSLPLWFWFRCSCAISATAYKARLGI